MQFPSGSSLDLLPGDDSIQSQAECWQTSKASAVSASASALLSSQDNDGRRSIQSPLVYLHEYPYPLSWELGPRAKAASCEPYLNSYQLRSRGRLCLALSIRKFHQLKAKSLANADPFFRWQTDQPDMTVADWYGIDITLGAPSASWRQDGAVPSAGREEQTSLNQLCCWPPAQPPRRCQLRLSKPLADRLLSLTWRSQRQTRQNNHSSTACCPRAPADLAPARGNTGFKVIGATLFIEWTPLIESE